MVRQSLFIAQRFLRTITAEKNIATMLSVCFASIALGTFALALVAAIMNGFEKTTRAKLQGIHTDITIQAFTRAPLAYQKIKTVLESEFAHAIYHIAPYNTEHTIIQSEESEDALHIVAIQGIDPDADQKARTLAQNIKTPGKFSDLFAENKILIGSSLAQKLHVETGDRVTLLHPSETQIRNRKLTFEQNEVAIGGIFATGIDNFDSSFIFCSYKTLHKFFPESGIDQIGIKLQPNTNSEQIIQQLKNRLGLDVFAWHELYLPLMSALMLEKYAMIIILALVALVASMNIISLLFMYITQKRSSIAILQAMGMPQHEIRRIFIIIGMCIAGGAGLVGLLTAWFTSWALETYQLIKLPAIYYASHVPAEMSWHILVLVTIIVCLVSLIATLVATRNVRHITIAQTLKFEG